MKRSFCSTWRIVLFLTLSACFVSCANDGIWNEETNREAVKKKKKIKDSIRLEEIKKKDSVGRQKTGG